jgi:hypothetical protein
MAAHVDSPTQESNSQQLSLMGKALTPAKRAWMNFPEHQLGTLVAVL